MTKLSVNINKIATIRNARGGNIPDVIQMAKDIESFGADGITVHPRPDERHIRKSDVFELSACLSTEFNIEGNPTETFIELVNKVKPHQVTLVPDAHDAITSSSGWDTVTHLPYLKGVVKIFKDNGIRVSIFVNPIIEHVVGAANAGADRVELYTEPYALGYTKNKENAILPYIKAAQKAQELGLGLNAGHDLNLENLTFFNQEIPGLKEVSIGHALISDALYYGLKTTIDKYKTCLLKP